MHNQLHRQDDAQAILLAHHNALHPGQGAGTNPRPLPHGQQSVRFNLAKGKANAQGLNLRIGQRCRLPARAAHEGQHSRHLQNLHTLAAAGANKEVAGKKRQIQGDCRAVAPLAQRMIERQVMLDLSGRHMLSYALLMAGRGVDGEPLRHELLLRRAVCRAPVRMKIDAGVCNLRQLFALIP